MHGGVGFTLAGNTAGFQSAIPIEDFTIKYLLKKLALMRVENLGGRKNSLKFEVIPTLRLDKSGKMENGRGIAKEYLWFVRSDSSSKIMHGFV
jgi:hypothetical protein